MRDQVDNRAEVSVCVERISKHIRCLAGIRHPNTGLRALNAAADYIGRQLYEVGAAVSEHFFTVDDFRGVFRNVEGVINAGATAQEWVICAHYDTVCNSPGAGDNASEVGVMLEAARALAEYGTEPTIRCIGFSLEEGSPVEGDKRSRLGSRAWVNCAQHRGIDLRGVINLESVGYVSDCQRYPRGFDPECFLNYRLEPKCGNFVAILSCEYSTGLGLTCLDQLSQSSRHSLLGSSRISVATTHRNVRPYAEYPLSLRSTITVYLLSTLPYRFADCVRRLATSRGSGPCAAHPTRYNR